MIEILFKCECMEAAAVAIRPRLDGEPIEQFVFRLTRAVRDGHASAKSPTCMSDRMAFVKVPVDADGVIGRASPTLVGSLDVSNKEPH